MQRIENIQASAEAAATAAAAKGEQRQEAMPTAEHSQPEVRLAKMPHAQNKRTIRPFGHGWTAGGKVIVRTCPACLDSGISLPL